MCQWLSQFVIAQLYNVFEQLMLHEVYPGNVKVFLKRAEQVVNSYELSAGYLTASYEHKARK
ncbi:hypothetical protein SAMN05428949_2301 [Chitinophaga sp. YR627]|nr:hypothetical protein SAMN05428949_2301 [Chitinophaga sp. YR627]